MTGPDPAEQDPGLRREISDTALERLFDLVQVGAEDAKQSQADRAIDDLISELIENGIIVPGFPEAYDSALLEHAKQQGLVTEEELEDYKYSFNFRNLIRGLSMPEYFDIPGTLTPDEHDLAMAKHKIEQACMHVDGLPDGIYHDGLMAVLDFCLPSERVRLAGLSRLDIEILALEYLPERYFDAGLRSLTYEMVPPVFMDEITAELARLGSADDINDIAFRIAMSASEFASIGLLEDLHHDELPPAIAVMVDTRLLHYKDRLDTSLNNIGPYDRAAVGKLVAEYTEKMRRKALRAVAMGSVLAQHQSAAQRILETEDRPSD